MLAELSQQQDEQKEEIIDQSSAMTLKHLISIKRKVMKNKKIIIDLSGTKYSVIWNVMEKEFQWECGVQESEDWNLMWNDTYITDEDLRKMLPFQKINHFPGSQNIGRKNELGKNLRSMKKIFKEDFDFFPKTWLLPYQGEELRQHHLKYKQTKPVYIIKPEASCQGRGIFLSKKIDQLIVGDSRFVVQEYLKTPFLIEGLKFDLRIYVLLKSVTPLKIFMYQEGLGRLATVTYNKPSKKNLNNMCMHLTNYAVNKRSKDFIFNDGDDAIGHKRSLTAVLNTLKQMGHDEKKILLDIRQVLVKTLCSVQPYLAHIYRSCGPRDDQNEQCFELFGFDIMLDETLKPWLIEVNHTPSFSTDTKLDLQIKKSLIMDTLILVNVKNKYKKQYFESKRAQTYQKPQKKSLEEKQEFQKMVEKYENKNLNGFLKIHPAQDDPLNYEVYMDAAQKLLDEWAGTSKQPQKKVVQQINTQPQQDLKKTSIPHKEIIKRPQSSITRQTQITIKRPLSTITRGQVLTSQRNQVSIPIQTDQEQNYSVSGLEIDSSIEQIGEAVYLNNAFHSVKAKITTIDVVKSSLPPKPQISQRGVPPKKPKTHQTSLIYPQQLQTNWNQLQDQHHIQGYYGLEQLNHHQMNYHQMIERNGYNLRSKIPKSLSQMQLKFKNDTFISTKPPKEMQERRKQDVVSMVPIRNFNFQDKLNNLLNLQKE